MPRIQKLSTHLVNKIAAGEVIERPASVIKELVENAIDAGATRIEIAVEDGGKRLLAVSDDGCGMGPEDLALAFQPHATSKLREEDDLFRIATMGFRGEALASIAAIAHAHIRTCPRDGDRGGWEIDAGGEEVGQVRPCPAAAGTTISIRNLFYNTPARRKFLRTASTEFGHICEQLARIALAYPQIAFRLTHNNREVQHLPPVTTTLQRVADLFGQELAGEMLVLAGRDGPVGVQGLIGRPAGARSAAKWQYLFLNGRYIRDRLLLHALREAYRGLLAPNRWPVAFVFLEIDPQEVDVNVHPTKVEVRFRNGQQVHAQLYATLKETLNQANLTPDANLDRAALDDSQEAPDAGTAQRRASVRDALADFFKSQPPVHAQPVPTFRRDDDRTYAPADDDDAQGAPRPLARLIPDRLPAGRTAHATFIQPPVDERDTFAPVPTAPREAAEPAMQTPALSPPPAIEFAQVVQVGGTYLVFGEPDALVIVDQHALHERILYNDFRRRLTAGRLEGQRLLIPEPLNVTAAEEDLLADQQDLLARLGIEVQAFGPGTVAIHQFPTILIGRGVQPRSFLRELLDQFAEDETTDAERLLEAVLAMMACKAAVKAGDAMTPSEVEDLLTRQLTTQKASSCPHGRPTTLRIPLRDLEKQFKRT